MNVAEMKVPWSLASSRYREYRDLEKVQELSAEDETLKIAHKAVKEGKIVIDLTATLKAAGTHADHRPKLAICRAHFRRCRFRCFEDGAGLFGPGRPEGDECNWARPTWHSFVRLPRGTWPRTVDAWSSEAKQPGARIRPSDGKTLVPSIPPSLRPKHGLYNYHVLWDVESWDEDPPVDPMLLHRVGKAGFLFVVLATWDLTELERAVLRGRIV
jgi:hypothetical protein